MGFPQDKRAPNALYNAAVLYKGLKNFDEAIQLLTEFTHRYGDSAIAPDATMELASLLERRSRYAEAVQVYETYAKRYPQDVEQSLFASAKAASLKVTSGDRAQGLKDLDKVKRRLVAKGAPAAFEARRTVAETLFKQAEPAFGEFQATQVSDGTKIEKQVGDKQAKLERLARSYEQIIDLGSAEFTVASLYRLGEAHENFANALFKAPAPKGSSQSDIDKLKTELEKVAFPLKDEAYKFFETAYKRSREVETFTTWTRRTYQKMVELAPEKHPEVNEMSAEPTYLTHELKMNKPVAEVVGATAE
jgi:tetratricopeptide (TPR) repeat protein